MEEDKITWRSGKISKKDMYISDEAGQWRDVQNKLIFGDWKPEVWYGYNEKGELIYNKFDEEE